MLKYFFSLSLLFSFFLSNAQENLTNLEDYFKQKNITPEKTTTGIFYTFSKKGTGKLPMRGDYVKVNYVGRLLNDKIFDQTTTEPLVFQVGYGQMIEGWEKGITAFPVGSKGTIYIPSAMAYSSQGNGDIPPDAPIVFELEVLKVLNQKEYDAYMIDLEQKEQQAFETAKKTQFDQDKRLINDYALSHKMKVKRTETGLSYIITKQGKGDTAKEGDVLQVNYEGTLLDGKAFDSTKDKKSFEFLLGYGRAMDGWEEGLKFFNKGSEGYLLIPSRLAYGLSEIDRGEIHIPANSVLIFKIQLVDIQKK